MGITGPKGDVGEKGEPGMKGPQGPSGVKGEPVSGTFQFLFLRVNVFLTNVD